MGERLYRLALFAYPRAFRQRYANDMLDYFRCRRATLRQRRTRWARIRLVCEMGRDLVRSAPRERIRDAEARRRSVPEPEPRRRPPRIEPSLADARAAGRSLIREPGFSLTVVMTLALGVGASAAVFMLVDGVLLEPLPYREPDRLAFVTLRNARSPLVGMSVVDYQAVAERGGPSFESLAAVIYGRQANAGGPALPNRVAVNAGGEPRSASAAWVAGQLFSTLGVAMEQGRDFRPGEDVPGADPVVVLSYSFAESVLGGDAVGRTIAIEGLSHTVVGVLPASAAEVVGIRADVWPQFHLYPPGRRGPFYMRGYARLADGATLDRATADLERVSEEIFPLWSDGFQDTTARLVAYPLRDVIVGDLGSLLYLVAGAVALVLVITVANIAGLTLTRAVGRRRELAVRAALGAGRGRLARLILVDNLLLAAAGGVLGAAFAWIGIEAFRRLGPPVPRLDEVGADAGFVGFVMLVTLLSGLLIAASPLAMMLSRGAGGAVLSAGRGSSSGRAAQRARSALLFAEFALTVPLLLAGGLLLVSLLRLQSADPGFDPDGVFAVPVSLPEARYPDWQAAQRFWQEAEGRAAAVPGVTGAGFATALPPDLAAHFNNFDLLDRPVDSGDAQPTAHWSTVTPGFFQALAPTLIEGRTLRASDDDDSPLVAVVTRAWARRHYPGESAIGRQMIAGGCIPCGPTTVVGVIADVNYTGLDGDGEGVFAPARQESPRNMYLVVRADRPVADVVPLVRRSLRDLDADLPFEAMTMDDRLADSLSQPRGWTLLLGSFGVAAILLVAVGIFGLLSYFVDRQRREIGVRMALGADGRRVVRMVVGRGLTVALLGTAAGLAASVPMTGWLESMLYEVRGGDPLTWVGVVALVIGVALAACWIPARRAAGVEPCRALLSE